MATPVIPRLYVEAPARPARHGGLLSVAKPIPMADRHGQFGVQYLPDGCDVAEFAPGLCNAVPALAGIEPKTFGDIPVIQSLPFGLYTGIECFTDESSDYEDRAKRALDQSETYGVERALDLSVFQADPADTGVIVVSGTYNIAHAIGELEQRLGASYPGLPMIHMTRRAAALAGGAVMAFPGADFTLATIQGTPIANGSGYSGTVGPDSTDADAGSEWLYGTGLVSVFRGADIKTSTYDLEHNKRMALAERIYSVTVECVIFAIQATI
jgi:hypothetical protein